MLGLMCTVGALWSGAISHAAELVTLEEPRAWYILAQADTADLLMGLPQRLSQAIAPSRRSTNVWQGVEGGGQLRLTIEYEGNVDGEVFVGFYDDPRWWLSEPKQVRSFPGPGSYLVENLIPGDYCLGAMVGRRVDFAAVTYSLPDGCGLGVHDSWPNFVKIRSGETTDLRLRVSNKYRLGFDDPNVTRGTFGLWDKVSPSNLIIVRTIDAEGQPLPYCQVRLSQLMPNDPDMIDMDHYIGTDARGVGICDSIHGKYRVTFQAKDFVPELLAHRHFARSFPAVRDASAPTIVELTVGPFPTGSAKVEGRVHNQFGQPLREFYITLSRQKEYGKSDWEYFSVSSPFTNEDGRFEIPNLPAGAYTVMIRHFDYPSHVYRRGGHAVVVPEEANASVTVEFQVEAKELLYGRAVFEDGTPVTRGGWKAQFTKDPNSPFGGDYFALHLEPDGRFRVCLSQEECRQVLENFAGMIDVSAYGDANQRTTLKLHIDALSENADAPTPVVFRRSPVSEQESPGEKELEPAAPAQDSVDEPALGEVPIPNFDVLGVDGRALRRAQFQGKPLVLNLFGTWCYNCVAEMPFLMELHEQYGDDGLVVLVISNEADAALVEDFARDWNLPFQVAIDATGKAVDMFRQPDGELAFPTTVVTNGNHEVVASLTGFDQEKLSEAVKNAIGQAVADEQPGKTNPDYRQSTVQIDR